MVKKLEALVNAINDKKSQMIKIGMEKGFSHEATIQCSQELDELINQYNRYVLKTKRSNELNKGDRHWLFPLEWMYKAVLFPYSCLGDWYTSDIAETYKQLADYTAPFALQASRYQPILVYPPFGPAIQKSYDPYEEFMNSMNTEEGFNKILHAFSTSMNKLSLGFLEI